MNTTKHHGDVKSQTPQKTCGVFFVEFGIGQMYLHYMTGCQLYEYTVEMPTPI